MKYNAGDVIIFRNDLEVDELYDNYYYTDYMERVIAENGYSAHIIRARQAFVAEYDVDIFDDTEVVVTDAMIAGVRPTADESEMLGFFGGCRMKYNIQRFLDGGFAHVLSADALFLKFDSKDQLYEFKAQLEAEHPKIFTIALGFGRIDYAYVYERVVGRVMYSTEKYHIETAIPASSLAIYEVHTDDLLDVLGV